MTVIAPLSMYSASVPVFQQMLGALSGILDKVGAHAVARKIDPAVMLGLRLAPDMFPVSRQIQISCDFAKGTVARLAGVDNPKFADTETTIDQLKERIASTLAFIDSVPASSIEGSEAREVTFTAGPTEMQFQGLAYLVSFALPNFYFHVTTTYAILRANGLDVDKFDYMGMKRPGA